jgi:hypothetical protein
MRGFHHVAEVRFDMDDAWLFWAIPASEQGTDLRGMISAADAINHAIPSREHIVRTVNRGLRAGLIEVDRGRFRFAPDICDEIAAATGKSATWSKQWDALYAYLSSREWQRIARGTFRLSDTSYRKTVEEYVNSF